MGGWAGVVWRERERVPAVRSLYICVCLMHASSGAEIARKKGESGKNSLDSLYLVLWSKLFKNFITESYIAPFSLSSECSEKMLFFSLSRSLAIQSLGDVWELHLCAHTAACKGCVGANTTERRRRAGKTQGPRAAIIMNNLFGINLYIPCAHTPPPLANENRKNIIIQRSRTHSLTNIFFFYLNLHFLQCENSQYKNMSKITTRVSISHTREYQN